MGILKNDAMNHGLLIDDMADDCCRLNCEDCGVPVASPGRCKNCEYVAERDWHHDYEHRSRKEAS